MYVANFSERLRTLRKQRGLSQSVIADLLGVNKQTISEWERGRRRPVGTSALEVYEKLADFFNVDMMYLLGQTDVVIRLCGEGEDPEDADVRLEVTPEELALIKAYRRLDEYAKRLTRMAARMEEDGDVRK